MASEEISLSPWLSSSRTIFDTAWSIRSGSTGRLRSAICTERSSLSRSNGTRSKVVKRKLQARQTRRRRMTELSSVGRESFTWVSRLPQLGQRMKESSARRREDVLVFAAALSINRESTDELFHFCPYGGFDGRIGPIPFARERIQYFHDKLSDLLELAYSEPAGCSCRGT